MNDPAPKDPDYEARVRASFASQGLMTTLGASLLRVSPGQVEISLPASAAGASAPTVRRPRRISPAGSGP